jgi:hypothetical protein
VLFSDVEMGDIPPRDLIHFVNLSPRFHFNPLPSCA